MASITRGDGKFRVRVCVGRDKRTGKQIWRTASFPDPQGLSPVRTEKEIQRIADEWERQQRADFAAGLEAHRDKITLADFIGKHWKPGSADAGGKAYNTATTKSQGAARVLEYYGDKIRLGEISTESVTGFIRWARTVKGYKESTTRLYLGVLRDIMGYAVACGYLDKNPVEAVRPQDKPHVQPTEPDFLTPEEARAFLDALEDDTIMADLWKAFFSLCLFAGLRRGEALALTWADYDIGRRELCVSKSITLTGGKGGEREVKRPKSGRRRFVPVSDELGRVLDRRRAEVVSNYGEARAEWYIFGTIANPENPMNPNSAWGIFRRFQARHGLRRVSVHLLRHSFASLALGAGADLKAIQAALGHSRPSMTLQFYAGASDRQTRAAVDGVVQAVKGPAAKEKPVPGGNRNEPMKET